MKIPSAYTVRDIKLTMRQRELFETAYQIEGKEGLWGMLRSWTPPHSTSIIARHEFTGHHVERRFVRLFSLEKKLTAAIETKPPEEKQATKTNTPKAKTA